jgi:glycosyltransferase involved in cell wall biosynthesis/SAM-dependent methyltransferase
MNSRIAPALTNPCYLHLKSLSDVMGSMAQTCTGVMVDYGCGTKPYSSFFNKVQKYIGVDFEPSGPDDLLLPQDGRLPLPDEMADVVLSSQVLEHVPDVELHLAECLRVLKPGGVLILSTHGIWPYHTGAGADDYWRWTLKGLAWKIERAGFKVTRAEGVCRGFLCLVQQGLVLFDPFNPKNAIRNPGVRTLLTVVVFTINVGCRVLKSLFPIAIEAGDTIPIAVVVRAEKPKDASASTSVAFASTAPSDPTKPPEVSFLICSHRAPKTLFATLDSIRAQNAGLESAEIVLVNNGFSAEKAAEIQRYMEGSPIRFRLVDEPIPGQGFARKRSFLTAQGSFFVMLDDDNILDPYFLGRLLPVLKQYPETAAVTCFILPQWEIVPPTWLAEFGRGCLSYTHAALPIPRPPGKVATGPERNQVPRNPGGGMMIHRECALQYLRTAGPEHLSISRTGSSLIACEDSDIWNTVLESQGGVVFNPKLVIHHLIPPSRLKFGYLWRLNWCIGWSNGHLNKLRRGNSKVERKKEIAIARQRIQQHFHEYREKKKLLTEVVLYTVRELGYLKGRYVGGPQKNEPVRHAG